MADTQGMAKTSTRSLWKGAITFGLVHIPIGLYSATEETDVDFDWLDKRTLDPVGYKRINKRTGKEIDKDDIVKGIAYQKGEYVVLSPEEIQEAYPRTTQTIEIQSFVDVDDVPFLYLERPYYTAPMNKSAEKVYALLREALKDSRKAGIAKVVMHTKQHLALLVPCGPVLVVNLLRWGNEIRSWQDLPLPSQGKAAGLRESELKMARQLIDDMSGHWSASEFRDTFRDAIMKLVAKKAKAGETATVEPLEEAPEQRSADVIDLTELLRRSLKGGAQPGAAPAPAARKSSTRKHTGERERAVASSGKKTAAAKRSTRSTSKTARARRAA
jgi:DNA end-binding protein Ku